MIFSKNSRKAPHLLSLLVAFAVAVGMWYVVSVRDRLEVQLEVGIEYNGIPSGLVVTDGLVSKVQVRLRGPEILGPAPAPVVKVNNRFRYRCTLVGKNDKATREMLAWLQKDFAKDSANRGMNLFVDHNAAD